MKNLNTKLLAFQKEVGVISKDGKNPHFKSTYATLQNILSEVKPILSKFNLIVVQPVIDDKVYTFIIDAESGEKESASISLPVGLTPQQLGSAITYYRRYLLAGMLSLEMDDDDGNTASIGVDNRQWLNDNTKPFEEAIKFLQGGGAIDKIESKYKLSKQVREKLLTNAI